MGKILLTILLTNVFLKYFIINTKHECFDEEHAFASTSLGKQHLQNKNSV